MTIISNLAVKFSATGTDQVVRSNKKVEQSMTTVGKRAQKETKVVGKWMERHKMAIMGIAGATTALMWGIIKASPSLTAELDSTRMAFSFLAMTIGETLQPYFEIISDWAWRLAEAFAELPEPVKEAIGVIILALSGLAIALAGVTVKQLIFNKVALANPYVIIAVAIITLIAIIYKLETAYGDTGKKINTYLIPIVFGFVGALYVLETRFGLLSKAWEKISYVLGIFWDGLKKVIDFVKTVATTVITTFLDLWDRVWNTIKTIVATVILSIYYLLTGRFDKLGELWSKFGERMREIWGDLWDRILNTLRDFGNRIVEGVRNLVTRFWELLLYVIDPRNWGEIASKLYHQGIELVNSILTGIGNIGQKIWNWVTDKIRYFVTRIVSWAEGVMGMSPTLIEIGRKIVMSILKGIGNIGAKLWEHISGGLSAISDKIRGWAQGGLSWGKDLITNFSDGIKGATKTLSDTAKNTFDKVRNVFSFDIVVNDRMIRGWGGDFMVEWAEGFKNKIGYLEKTIEGAMFNMQAIMSPEPTPTTPAPQTTQSPQQNIVTFERGAIQINPSEMHTLDEDILADRVTRKIEDTFRGRS